MVFYCGKQINKMKKLLILLILAFFVVYSNSCKDSGPLIKPFPLTFERQDYSGNEIRLDGYFYLPWNDSDRTRISRGFFFYTNGVVHVTSSGEISKLEDNFVRDGYHNKIKDWHTSWGLFKINGTKIEIEFPTLGGRSAPMIHSGLILNDSTFKITRITTEKHDRISEVDETYYFRHFSPKPDSTNSVIK